MPAPLRRLARQLSSQGTESFVAPLVVTLASEVVLSAQLPLPGWATEPGTRYLVLVDVPEPGLFRLPSVLGLRKPEQRLHATQDPGAVRRLLIGSARRDPYLGIVDAYVLGETLELVTGDFHFRSFPLARLPGVGDLPPAERAGFEIDEDGAYLHWPAPDLHLGVAQMLQAVDPSCLADISIKRYSRDHTGAALEGLREANGLRQADIPGLSERQVRRIEGGVSRLSVDAARKFAGAFGISLEELLDEVARRAGRIRADAGGAPERAGARTPAPGSTHPS